MSERLLDKVGVKPKVIQSRYRKSWVFGIGWSEEGYVFLVNVL